MWGCVPGKMHQKQQKTIYIVAVDDCTEKKALETAIIPDLLKSGKIVHLRLSCNECIIVTIIVRKYSRAVLIRCVH